MKQSLTNKHTKKIHFPGKMPICKHQQIDYFLLINNVPTSFPGSLILSLPGGGKMRDPGNEVDNVPDFEKMSVPFLNNNNNLFLHSTLFLNEVSPFLQT